MIMQPQATILGHLCFHLLMNATYGPAKEHLVSSFDN